MTEARAKWLDRARDDQLTPKGDWSTWLILAGRGWGKTRTGAEDVAWYGMANNGWRIHIIAPTYADARDTCVEGESGLLSVLPDQMVEVWNRSLGELILKNGTRYKLFSADEPNRLRGPQAHRCWADELAAWKSADAYDQAQFGLRLGTDPRMVITTTPKPTPMVRRILADPRTYVTRGKTMDNAANLAPSALETLQARYAGTRLGRQELNAEILDDVPGALWTRATLDLARVDELPEMQRIVVAIDPSGASDDDSEGSDAIGIVVVGRGVDGLGYVLADRTISASPAVWGRRAVAAFHEFGADRIVAERNYGGAMVEHVIKTADRTVSYKEVTASRGKTVRAEPIAALYEQNKVKHVRGLDELEDQFCQFSNTGYLGIGSPDRADAAVWGLTELFPPLARPLIKVAPKARPAPFMGATGWMG